MRVKTKHHRGPRRHGARASKDKADRLGGSLTCYERSVTVGLLKRYDFDADPKKPLG